MNANQLKMIAMVAMTIDHLTAVIYPGYPTDWWILLLHVIGRLAAPIFWFFIVEGYYHTHNWKRYAFRLFIFAVISHFTYNFAFGIPFIPFQTSLFNQTSVIWSLFGGLARSGDQRLFKVQTVAESMYDTRYSGTYILFRLELYCCYGNIISKRESR